MAGLLFEYFHKAGLAKAKEVIDEIISENSQKFSDSIENLDKKWQNDSLIFSGKARGITISGSVNVYDDKIQIKANIPFIAMPFKSRIKETILNELKDKL